MAATDDLSGLLKLALDRGASPNAVRDDGMTLLHWAIGYRALKNVDLIVAAGARLDTRDDTHQMPSPLSFALQRRLWSYARLLVERGAPLKEAPGITASRLSSQISRHRRKGALTAPSTSSS